MNKREHVVNGLLLGIALGYVLEPAGDVATFVRIVEVTPPVVLGALLPDIDTAFGRHRKLLHNLPVLAGFYVFPAVFGNLNWVWIGVLGHYVLDVAGTERGIALFYPYPEEYGLPIGVNASGPYAPWMTLAVTVVEVGLVVAVAAAGLPVVGIGQSAEQFAVTFPRPG